MFHVWHFLHSDSIPIAEFEARLPTQSMDYQTDINHRRLVWASVLSLAALLSQYTVNSFISSMTSRPPKMNWPPNEVSTLVHYLHKHHERIGDGGNFRQDIYAAAAAHLNMIHPNPTHPKTADAVKNKWMSFVSHWSTFDLLSTPDWLLLQLRKTFHDIEAYWGKSGCHWDNEKGANIVGADAEEVFNGYVKVC